MSSLRNAVQRRQHRERGQLEGREKWGILEKHKDYSLRAKDYNTKKAKLKRLEEKARNRNPDEFAFGMMSERSRAQGKHGARDSAAARGLSHDAIKLLKTQDAGYLRVVGERVRREKEKIERDIRLQEGMQEIFGEDEKDNTKDDNGDDDDFDFDFDFDDEKKKNKPQKLVFADSREEQKKLKKQIRDEEDADSDDNKDEDDGDDSFLKQLQNQSRNQNQQRKSKKQLEAERQALVEARRARKLKKRAAEARRNKLAALTKQYNEIVAAERELDWQRGKMDNSVGGTNKNGIKWKIRERKK